MESTVVRAAWFVYAERGSGINRGKVRREQVCGASCGRNYVARVMVERGWEGCGCFEDGIV